MPSVYRKAHEEFASPHSHALFWTLKLGVRTNWGAMGFNPRRGCSETGKGACKGRMKVLREKPSSQCTIGSYSRRFYGIRKQGRSRHWGHSGSKAMVIGQRGMLSWEKQWVPAAASSFLDSSENSNLYFSGQAKEEKEASSCPSDQADTLRRKGPWLLPKLVKDSRKHFSQLIH